MIVLVDRREQLPWAFDGLCVEPATIDAGDYTVMGLEGRLAIERKSLSDWIGSISTGRKRFEREMDRLAQLERAVIIVEAHVDDVCAGAYRSKMHPNAALGSAGSIFARWGIATCFAGSREAAQAIARAILIKADKHLRRAA